MPILLPFTFQIPPELTQSLGRIELQLTALREGQDALMTKADDLLAALAEANTTTNDIADDITALLAKLADGGLTPAEADMVKEQIAALNGRLKSVAAQYPPAEIPTEPTA